MWAPFLTSSDSILAVLLRVFPTQRGLFEDYVANFWCVSSLVIKWKRLVQPQVMFRLCTGATLAAFLPSMIAEIAKPSTTGFLLCLANTAMSFFMFSFQVHEKSILIPLLPLTMLSSLSSSFSLKGVGGVLGPALMHSVMLSMYPLLEKDGLQDAYVGLLIIHLGLVCLLWRNQESSTATTRNLYLTKRTYISTLRSPWSHFPLLSLAIITAIHGIRATMPPPSRYPFLWDALMISWAFLNFIEVFIHLYKTQLQRK
jgi:alpha-1,3-glucosyltransferase